MKRCTKCREEKPIEGFGKQAASKDGLQSWCRPCKAAWSKENWSPEKQVRSNERTQAWRAANPEKVRALGREYRADNHEAYLAREAAYREAHPLTDQRREANRESARRFAEENPERVAATKRRWTNANHNYARSIAARNRARRALAALGSDSAVVYVSVAEIMAASDGVCGICHEPLTSATSSIDHIVPLALGGAHTRANLQAAHRRCNSAKDATTRTTQHQ